MAYLLGIDIGTSGTKSVIFDEQGKTIASDTKEYPLYQPENGWAEQDPEDWWDAVCHTVKNALSKGGIDPSGIKGVGLSGQMHGTVVLDDADNVLRKAIIWCDQRSSDECDEITEAVTKEKLIEITANPALTGFSASKIMWIRNNEPHIFERISKILLPKDYIRYKLTGEFATEVSDASGTQFLDVPQRKWSDYVLDKLSVKRQWLPRVYESIEISGKVCESASKLCNLTPGTPVAGGGGDQACGAVGNGIVEGGLISSTIGTSGVVFAHCDELYIDPKGRIHTFCHAVPGAWHVMGVTQGAGLSLKWFRDNFCLEEMATADLMGVDPYVLMDREAERIPAGSEKLIFLPYLMGERTPHLDSNARGVFFGISAIHTKAHMIRSIMEGVAFSLKDCLDIIGEANMDIRAIRASGGGGKSPLWRQIMADVFGKSVHTINSTEGPALGAALIAGVGTGIYKSVGEACRTAIKTDSRTDPKPADSSLYKKHYALYGDLYKSLRDDFKKLAKI